jgi:hypothetical protein
MPHLSKIPHHAKTCYTLSSLAYREECTTAISEIYGEKQG